MTGFFKSFVYFTLHLLSHVCLHPFLFLMVHQYLLYVFPDILPCSLHQKITIIHSFPAYAHCHSVLIKYIIHISVNILSTFSSFTLSCCFNPGAVSICYVAGNSHLYILTYFILFSSLSPSFTLRCSHSSLAFLPCIPISRRPFLISLSRSPICF